MGGLEGPPIPPQRSERPGGAVTLLCHARWYPVPQLGGSTMAAETFDRKAEDVGNIVLLEHVNFRVPDQQLATAFYVSALGFTRDPYLMVGLDNMWINLGRSQFHLPTGAPNHSRGRVGCVVSDFDALPERLKAADKWLGGTRYTHTVEKNHADVTCPWGNRIRLHRAGSDFGGSHAKLNERGIVSQESNPYQYRFQEIVDPDSGKLLYEIEHEVRSFTHPMYARPLVNRNPAQRQPTYQPGQDAFYPRY